MPTEEPESRVGAGQGSQRYVGPVKLEVLVGRPVENRCPRSQSGSEAQLRGISVQGERAQPQTLGSTGRSQREGRWECDPGASGDSGQSGRWSLWAWRGKERRAG